MSGGNKKRLWEGAIIALLQYPDIRSAARAAKISEVSLFRWLKNPEFSEKYHKARQNSLDITINKLQQSTGIAVETLIKVAKDGKSPMSCRVSAAKAILDLSLKAIHLNDLRKQVEAVKCNENNDLAKIMEDARKRVVNSRQSDCS